MTEDDFDKQKKPLKQDDAELWRHMTGDVDPMPGATYQKGAKNTDKPDLAPKERVKKTILPEKQLDTGKKQISNELDRRTDERLRRGQIQLEGRLDLHGFRQHEAKDRLDRFIKNSYASGKRCVLVITGKGGPKTSQDEAGEVNIGVLRQKVPIWLSQPPLSSMVLKSHIAQPKDGGAGALYVYLRRKR